MIQTFFICFKSDLKYLIKNVLKNIFGINVQRITKAETKIRSKVSVRKIKNIIIHKGFAVSDGQASWFYTAYERGDHDPLTNFALDFILNNVNKDSNILVTGCGTGIMAFYLADNGYKKVSGFDYLQECVDVANEISVLGDYAIKFYQDDGFNPELGDKQYDLITAMHWVFSAWMGNYGNKKLPNDKAFSNEFRESVLIDFLGKYATHLNKGGMMILELTDAVTDYRIPTDHYLGEYSKEIYPIRHTPEQVSKCAGLLNMEIIHRNISVSYGQHPRTQYVLKKL